MLILKQIPLLTPLAENSTMEIVIYHCLVLGFAAMALKMAKEKEGLHCQGRIIRRNHGRRLSDTGPHWACHLHSIFLGRKLVLRGVAYFAYGLWSKHRQRPEFRQQLGNELRFNRRRRLAGAYGIMLLPAAVPVQTIGDLAWGLNFLWVLVAALTIKAVVSALKKKDVIKRCYTKNHLMGRISGTMFDAMIAVGIMAIALRM